MEHDNCEEWFNVATAALAHHALDLVRRHDPACELCEALRAMAGPRGQSVRPVDTRPLPEWLDPARRAVVFNGRSTRLTPSEWRLVTALARRGDFVRSEDLGILATRDGRSVRPTQVARVNVARLREKLAAAGLPDVIDNIKGYGYRLRDPAEPPALRAVAS